MELEITEDFSVLFKKVFGGIKFETEEGETLIVCMRDTGFEINYNTVWYELKANEKPMRMSPKDQPLPGQC